MVKAIVRCDKRNCELNKNGYCESDVVYLDDNGKCDK